jgi:hypothetical protein
MHCLFAFFLKETGGAKAPSVIYLKRKEKTRSTTEFTKNKGENYNRASRASLAGMEGELALRKNLDEFGDKPGFASLY